MSGKCRILCVVGTRPEAIKMAPVILELQQHPDVFELQVKATAQHRDLLDQALGTFSITPDHDLDIMTPGQTLTDVTCGVLQAMHVYFKEHPTDLVMVVGDTTTAMATAMACFYDHVPVAHVEAGLRTWNRREPHPEEFNRRATGLVCDFHFAPTTLAAENLRREGVEEAIIHVTGNPVIDALHLILRNTEAPPTPIPDGKPYILMTCHRREIFGKQVREVFEAVRDFALSHPDLYIWFPVHPNPNIRKPAYELLGPVPNIVLDEPIDYVHFVHAMRGALLVLSDSGGVQEEAPSLGKPVLVLRNRTERPEAVEAGTCLLVGPNRERILTELERLLTDKAVYDKMAGIRNPFGDGTSAKKIVSILKDAYNGAP